jgi:hypothetical protein
MGKIILSTNNLKKQIQSSYIQVKREKNGVLTYGGDQGFFDADSGIPGDKKKKERGCGVIAFADLLLYLGRKPELHIKETDGFQKLVLTEQEYKAYFNRIYRLLGGIPFKGGVSSLFLTLRFNIMALTRGFSMFAIWGFSRKKLPRRILKMLEKDIPVILCIPMMLLPGEKKDGLRLYERQEKEGGAEYVQKAFTRAHYVMVTGVISENGRTYYEISSWGKQYYISRKEYDTLQKTHFLGSILGNILYIRPF